MKNVAASVLARLKNVARERNLVYNEVLLRYAIERVLKRIELSPHASKCILKGGSLFILWSDGFSYRPTMDADLEFRGDGSPENLLHVFRDVANISGEGEDGLCIDAKSISATHIREDDQYGGVRVTMMTHIGTVRIPVQFDVGIGDAVTPVARKAAFPTLLDGDAPCIRVYPRETVVAEKFETIVKRGFANSRMKDYYDLLVLSRDSHVNREVLKLAIARTFTRRKTELSGETPSGLADAFGIDSVKLTQWGAFIRKNRLDVGNLSLLDVVRILRRFLMGVVRGSSGGVPGQPRAQARSLARRATTVGFAKK